ncbi:MAG: hypothetical protein R2817_03715 [Flavobacteriales bacterium]
MINASLRYHSITLSLALPLLLLSTAMAQEKTKEGYTKTWDRPITVVPDSMLNGTHKLPAYTIAVHEADAGEVIDLWKADMKALSREVTGSKPLRANGVVLTELGTAPVNLAVMAVTEKKSDLSRLTVAFLATDSTAMPAAPEQEAYVRSLAVKYNKAIVQKQIDAYQKMLDRSSEKLADAQGDEAKLKQRMSKANNEVAKLKAKRGKVMADNARVQGDISGLEKKFALTNDPKDLQRLTKARQKLAKGESKVAKLMQSEAKAQDTVNKYQDKLPKASSEQQDITLNKEEITNTLNALKRKQDNIR